MAAVITFADYCAIDAVNWSSLKHLWAGSPLHYKHHRESADKDTTGRKMGRLLHAMALGSFDEEFVVYDGGDRRGKAWTDFQAANPGRTILKPNEVADVRAQAAAVRAHREASRILAGADTEATIQWTDPETGLPCKGRLDAMALASERIGDLKGCGGLATLDRTCHRLGYVHQLAWYRRGVRIAHGVECAAYMIGVETKAPHDVGVWRVDRDLLKLAENEIIDTMYRLSVCIERNNWPGSMPEVEDMYTPNWMLSDEFSEAIPEEGLELFSDL